MEWSQFIILMVTMGGFLWSMKSDMNSYRSDATSDRRDMLQISRDIQQEIKDFHGRLERQDAEFKAHLQYHNNFKGEK